MTLPLQKKILPVIRQTVGGSDEKEKKRQDERGRVRGEEE